MGVPVLEGAQHTNLNLGCITVLGNCANDLDSDTSMVDLVVGLDDFAECPLTEKTHNTVCEARKSQLAVRAPRMG